VGHGERPAPHVAVTTTQEHVDELPHWNALVERALVST